MQAYRTVLPQSAILLHAPGLRGATICCSLSAAAGELQCLTKTLDNRGVLEPDTSAVLAQLGAQKEAVPIGFTSSDLTVLLVAPR